MKNIQYALLLIFFLLYPSCTQENKGNMDSNISSTSQDDDHFIVTSLGDSIVSGIEVRGKGKEVDIKKVSSPTTIPVGNQLGKTSISSNVIQAGQPKEITIPAKPRITTIGEDGVPIPETVPALGEPVPAIQPTQQISGTPQMKPEAIANLQFWTMDQGLNASRITDLLEDRRGHIWVITEGGGVSRFDGKHFTHYTINEGLPFNDPISMMEDSRGNIWIGGFQGLVQYDGHHFIHYTQKDGLEDVVIYSMAEDRQGNVWFGGHGHLTKFAPEQRTFTHYNTNHGFTANLPIRAIHEDKHGNFWVGSVWGGFYHFNPSDDGIGGRIAHYGNEQGFGQMLFNSILEDSQDQLWLGSSNGAYLFDISTNEIGNSVMLYTDQEGLINRGIFSIVEDGKGRIWFGTNGGACRLDDSMESASQLSRTFTHFGLEQGINNPKIRNIIEDAQGNIWLGTNDGLHRYVEGRFNFVNNPELNNYPIPAVLEDHNGNLWFGSNDSPVSLSRLSEQQKQGQLDQQLTFFASKEGFRGWSIQSLAEDSQNRIWIGLYGEGGICRYDPSSEDSRGSYSFYNAKEGLLTPYVHAIRADRQGNIWIGGVGGLTCFVSPKADFSNERIIHFSRKEGFPSYVVLSILEDSKGNLWFGHQRGVTRYDPDKNLAEGTYTHFTDHEGLSSGWITSIIEDASGNMWFGSNSGGVSRLNMSAETGIRFTQFTTENGLSHNIIHSIQEDDENNIWIGTQKGLNMLKPKSNVEGTNRNPGISTHDIYTFEQEDGLKNIDFAKGVSLDSKNRVWWGTKQGVASLDLNQFKFVTDPPNLKLSTIEIDQNYIDYRRLTEQNYSNMLSIGKDVSEGFDSVTAFFNYPVDMVLPYDLNHLTFRFAATDWTAPHKIQYSYWIEGVDKDWSAPVTEPMADYRNLPHGRHTLQVRAMGDGKIWSDPFEYSFRITPPWWLSPWAYVLYALLTVAAIWGIVRWRTATLRKRQKELEQTVTERTAEVVAQKDVIEKEKERSESLLLNILPADIAQELKVNGTSPARDFDIVTVLFTDFKGFTSISEKLTPQELVSELNTCFKAFDEITSKYNIEKIKTIGDAYMAAGGLQASDKTTPKEVVLAALEMQQFMQDRVEQRMQEDQPFFEMRCGIHSGPLVAGIVGIRKFQYDIWGDTVNMAARMESSGAVGKVNISQATYDFLKDDDELSFESRGKIKAKGKGEIEMYFVESLKLSEHSVSDF